MQLNKNQKQFLIVKKLNHKKLKINKKNDSFRFITDK